MAGGEHGERLTEQGVVHTTVADLDIRLATEHGDHTDDNHEKSSDLDTACGGGGATADKHQYHGK